MLQLKPVQWVFVAFIALLAFAAGAQMGPSVASDFGATASFSAAGAVGGSSPVSAHTDRVFYDQ